VRGAATGSSLRRMSAAREAAASSEAREPELQDRPVRVFLVADVCVYRELLVEALADDETLEVVGNTPGDIASVAIGMAEPAVVVLDTSSGSAPARVQALAVAMPAAKIVALGIHDDEATLIELVEAGVAGYVTAEQPLEELVEAVAAAAHGELRCSPRVSAALARRVAALRAELPRERGERRLTRRQLEIATLISEGLSNKQIARRLSIEQATVKNHVHNILSKLGVSHRDDVTAFVRASLLTALD
jgi:two-component system, NarL family, nitrate/nitrite response regulator NarL